MAVVKLDPYEIPEHLVPPGMIYQWVTKKQFGQPDKQYQTMLDAGWSVVPYRRLENHYRGRHRGNVDEIMIGGQVLMERLRDASKIARDKEMDQAVINAGSGRDASIDLVSRFNLSAFEIETAKSMSLSSSQYAAWRVKQIAGERRIDHRWLSWWQADVLDHAEARRSEVSVAALAVQSDFFYRDKGDGL